MFDLYIVGEVYIADVERLSLKEEPDNLWTLVAWQLCYYSRTVHTHRILERAPIAQVQKLMDDIVRAHGRRKNDIVELAPQEAEL